MIFPVQAVSIISGKHKRKLDQHPFVDQLAYMTWLFHALVPDSVDEDRLQIWTESKQIVFSSHFVRKLEQEFRD